jgi:cysteinyl-tRNA synthetase
VRKLNRFIQQLIRVTPGIGYLDTDQCIYDVKQKFSGALDDDFNISSALASLFEFVRQISVPLSRGLLNEKERGDVLDIMTKMDSVLGVINFKEEALSEEALRLLQERKDLRKAGNWRASDEIRKKLLDMGIEVSDTASGMMWRVK